MKEFLLSFLYGTFVIPYRIFKFAISGILILLAITITFTVPVVVSLNKGSWGFLLLAIPIYGFFFALTQIKTLRRIMESINGHE